METKDQIYISHYISQYHTAISPRDFLTRADQDYNMFPGLNGGGNLSPEAWTWGSRCSAWTKWKGHLNSLSRKGSLRFTHWSLVSILFGKKKKVKWWFISSNSVRSRRRLLTHVLGSDQWFPSLAAQQNPLGNFKRIQMPGHYSRPPDSKSPGLGSKNLYFMKFWSGGSELTSLS